MKSNIRVIQIPAGNTWMEVASYAGLAIAKELDFLRDDNSNKLNLVMPNGNGLIVDELTSTTLSVFPGFGWDHFEDYGLYHDSQVNGIMVDHDQFTQPYLDLPASVSQRAVDLLRVALMRTRRPNKES